MYAIYGNIYHQYTPNVSSLVCAGCKFKAQLCAEAKNCSHVVWANYHNSEMRTSDNP